MRTVLSIIQQVQGELGFVQPAAVFGSTEGTVIQLRSLLVASCDELADEFNWQSLIRTGTITTVLGQTEYTRPADLLRELPMTHWNRSSMRAQAGNTEPAIWEKFQSGSAAVAGASHSIRIAANKLVVFPSPPAGLVFSYQYISSFYAVDANTFLPKLAFDKDGDMTAFHDRCLTNLLKVKMLQAKGLDTTGAVDDFTHSLEAAKGGDAPAPMLSLVRDYIDFGDEHFANDVRVPQ